MQTKMNKIFKNQAYIFEGKVGDIYKYLPRFEFIARIDGFNSLFGIIRMKGLFLLTIIVRL